MMDSLVVEGDGQQKEQSRSSRSAVIVLGMHRSGTSALARVLNLLGCDLPKNLMAANPTNEAGHWEPQLIAALNDRILESGGSSWDDWLRFNPRWLDSPKAEEFCEEAVELTRSEFGGSRLFVLKDPRICRLLPFWQRVLQRLPTLGPTEARGYLRARAVAVVREETDRLIEQEGTWAARHRQPIEETALHTLTQVILAQLDQRRLQAGTRQAA